MQAFETWNEWNQEAIKRWKRTETRGMLSISTTGCYECEGVISPRAIRKGKGDRYLLTVTASSPSGAARPTSGCCRR